MGQPSQSTPWRQIQARAAELVRRTAEHDDGTSRAMAELLQQIDTYQTELRSQNRALQVVEAELAAASARFEARYDFAPVGLLSLDRRHEVVTLNATARRLLGLRRADAVGCPLSHWLEPTSADALHRHLHAIRGGAAPAAVQLALDPERTAIEGVRWLEFRGAIEPRQAGSSEHVWGALCDVTEPRASATGGARDSRLEAVSTLAAGIAHDFNNLLVPIELNLTHVLERLDPGDPAEREALEEAHQATRRASDLARQMMTFAREGPYEPERIDLASVVRDTVGFARGRFSSRAAWSLECPQSPVLVDGDRAQLQQALFNLLDNAYEALGGGGQVQVSLHLDEVGRGVLAVRDSGRGMCAREAARACDPFFTTKRTGRGLGLTAAAAVARQHGGTLTIDSVEGEGTRVAMSLPTMEDASAVESSRPTGRPPVDTNVLLIDDDALVRRATARALRRAGYRVVTASDGPEGLAHLAEEPAVDVVLLDMIMPEMGGPEVFAAMRARRPELSVLIVTGHYDAETVQSLLAQGAHGVVSKPFRGEALLEAVARALA